ncbi:MULTISPECIES: ABC transporter permease subunit [Arthrobacter]|uniref:ABC transporter permease subunit n=2 Tax=Arthrobacter TaxID=1663 RepID=A0ABU9KPB3_9MICC|nr:ABC transporter permease subunit [Arthrobacter sp. YJM1]MDP5228665.1 ABC transporter permease subunit [Arthrobacter sp. YJM1]
MALLTASRPHRGSRLGRTVSLSVAGVYFLVPLLCALAFTVGIGDARQTPSLGAYAAIFTTDGLAQSLGLSLVLAGATIVLVFGLLLPALLTVRLAAPRAKAVVAVVCMLPLVVPAVALGAGITTVLRWATDWLYDSPGFPLLAALQEPGFPVILVLAYTLMALPLAYTTLEAGLNAIDVKVLVEAARSCRASWFRTLFLVVLPNLREALLNTAFLTIALVIGEYAVSALLGFQPFAVWTVAISGSHAQLSVAVSLAGLIGTWLILLAVAKSGRSKAPKEKP